MSDLKKSDFPRAVQWSKPVTSSTLDGHLLLIDQINLPADPLHAPTLVAHHTVDEVIKSIKTMLVRGAPAIGAAGAFGMAIAALNPELKTTDEIVHALIQAKKELDASRPTAVNLSWATARIMDLAHALQKHNASLTADLFRTRILVEAQALADDDVKINKRLGDYGAQFVQPNDTILHHCNTGHLATVGHGTALGVIYSAHFHQSKKIFVYVDETRPRLQGARLTAWELLRERIPFKLIGDNAAASLMRKKAIQRIVFGADRVAANGDTANKIGTYSVCVNAKEHNIPTYACVPTSTIDLNMPNGDEIEIEERNAEEITHIDGVRIAPIGTEVYNPAFDVTPAAYITAIITEEGVCERQADGTFKPSLAEMKKRAEDRIQSEWAERLKVHLQQQ